MKKIVAIVAILVIMVSMSYGQEFVSSQSAGAKAILFTWSGLANINATEYQGGIGLKLFLSDYLALRGQIELGIASETDPFAGVAGQDGSKSASLLGIGAGIEYHMTKGRVSPYIGGVVTFQTTSTETKDAVAAGISQTDVKNTLAGITISGVNGGNPIYAANVITIAAILGAEYYITNGISLGAEYQLGFSSIGQKDETTTVNNATSTVKGSSISNIGIQTQGVLTLAVYF